MKGNEILQAVMKMAADNNQGIRMSTTLLSAKKDPRGGIVSFGVEEQDYNDAASQLQNLPGKYMICCFFIDREEFEKYKIMRD